MDGSSGIITTVAGNGANSDYSGEGGPATKAGFRQPESVALDSAGNMYIGSDYGHRVCKVDTSGTIITVAGTGTYGFSGDDGPATKANAKLSPGGVAVDSAGNLYISDGGTRVRRVDPAGIITTYAGDGSGLPYSGEGGPATNASISPAQLAIDARDDLLIAAFGDNRILKVDHLTGIIITVAGTGGVGSFSGDGGPARSATLDSPNAVTTDSDGNIYIADTGNFRIRKINRAGVISTVAGNGSRGYSGDGGPATSASFGLSLGVAVDKAGNLYIAAGDASGSHNEPGDNRVRKVDTSGIITTVAGVGPATFAGCFTGDGGPATKGALFFPTGITGDPDGNLYIADEGLNRIRKVDVAGVITTIGGNGDRKHSGDGGPAKSASFWSVWGVALDSVGNIYASEVLTGTVRKINTAGTVTAFAGNADLPPNDLIVGDGLPATLASLHGPHGLAVDSEDNVYIADSIHHRIRKVDKSGIITTVAGAGIEGYGGDGGPATAAQLFAPSDVAFDDKGNLYIADTYNYRIRKVDTAGNISTVAGNGGDVSGDGGPATSAGIAPPEFVLPDNKGNFYITSGDTRVRKVDAAGIITTVAGSDKNAFAGDGGPAAKAKFTVTLGMHIDPAGNLFIADADSNRIRKIELTPTPAQLMNISTRARVQTGDNVLIGGFIVTGNEAKKVILRAKGPSLKVNRKPIAGRLEDPVLELHDERGARIGFNDNWKDSPRRAEIEASGLAPKNERESAILRKLEPGAYTAIMRGKNNSNDPRAGSTGIGLVEAYDLKPGAAAKLANISSRGFVGTDENVMIGGFIAGGGKDRGNVKLVLRALGPSLTSKGVSNALQDPTLTVHNENGTAIASNDNWKEAPEKAEIRAIGLAPSKEAESALLMTLPPAAYTAIVRGKNGDTGVGLVEVYDVGAR
ncbi:MAG: hypothetical protein ABR589_00360 [Chthoniobacterales bacterium]